MIKLYITKCKRCKKPITSADCSLYGADELHHIYKEICKDCITPDEIKEINIGIGKVIAGVK